MPSHPRHRIKKYAHKEHAFSRTKKSPVHDCRPASVCERDECGPRDVRAELFFARRAREGYGSPGGARGHCGNYQVITPKFLAGHHQSHPVGFHVRTQGTT